MAKAIKVLFETKINEEDYIEQDEGFLVPVKNVWVVSCRSFEG